MTDPNQAKALAPCPFCGGIAEAQHASGPTGEKYRWIECEQCKAMSEVCDDSARANDPDEPDPVTLWNTRTLAAQQSPQPSEGLSEAVKPWADYHGDLPDYDHPLRCVYESGIQYAVELLAKELDVTDWEVCDGTEEFDGDLGGTMMNIVRASLPKDEHGDHLWPCEVVEALAKPPAQPSEGEGSASIMEPPAPAPDVDSYRDIFDDLSAMMGITDRPGPLRHVWKEMRPHLAAALAKPPAPAPGAMEV